MNWSSILERYSDLSPEKEFLIYKNKRCSYKEVRDRVNSIAKSFKNMEIGKGDIVAILLYNCTEYVELTFAINKIGAAWLPLNFRLAGPEFEYILKNSEAKCIVTEDEFVPVISKIQKNIPSLKNFVTIGNNNIENWFKYNSLVEKNIGEVVIDEEVNIDDLHRLMYTSGTTAHPKGVMITYGNLYWKNIGHILVFGLKNDDRTLICGPMYHVGGMDLPGTGTIYCGGSLVILDKFEPIKVLEAIEKEKVTNLWLSPAMTIMLFNESNFYKYDVSTVRFIIDGGEKMPASLIEKFKEKFPNAWFADAYGLTETVSGDTFLAKDKMLHKLGSVGKPVPHLRVKIVDVYDNEVRNNEIGEICFKGPKVFKGYWKNEEETKKAIKGGWFHTGDVGYLDDENFLYIIDRKKDIIISGGENVASSEVERVIYELPEVLEVAVVGIKHPKWLEVPKAFVVIKENSNLSEDEIISHCKNKLAKFKVPKEVEFITSLPRNPSGKVLKRVLRNK